jgi:transposase
VWLADDQTHALRRRSRLLRQLDFHGQELAIIDAQLSQIGLASDDVKRLMTIPGVDATVALSIVAAVGDFERFASPGQLVSYLGLNPRVRQSGGQPAAHGRITKQGRAHARGMLVEAAWSAAKIPGPLRAFFERMRSRRGMQIAIVATARKLTCLCWHLRPKTRTTRSHGHRSPRRSCAGSSSEPECPRTAAGKARLAPTH